MTPEELSNIFRIAWGKKEKNCRFYYTANRVADKQLHKWSKDFPNFKGGNKSYI